MFDAPKNKRMLTAPVGDRLKTILGKQYHLKYIVIKVTVDRTVKSLLGTGLTKSTTSSNELEILQI